MLEGYVKTPASICQPLCSTSCLNGHCIGPDQCECLEGYALNQSQLCEPVCHEICENGWCSAPNICSCYQGFNKTLNGTCKPICDKECINGKCIAPNNCECLEGFKKNPQDLCEPFCADKCLNGYCQAPGICECYEGYKKLTNQTCMPICELECINAECIAPNRCQCKEGYEQYSENECQAKCLEGYARNKDNLCEPICQPECSNGRCIAPKQCLCNQGYQLNTENICQPVDVPYSTEDKEPLKQTKSCENLCLNGTCWEGKCRCPDNQHIKAVSDSLICLPMCHYDKECLNGFCSENAMCECLEGYVFSPITYQCENMLLLSASHGNKMSKFLKWVFIFALISALLASKILLVMYCLTRKTSYNVDKKENEYGLIKLSQKADIIRQPNHIDV
ncbi:hypothetical protein DOY81_011054 [Sarcophaga bullata]|nr:hypothetical protein DOY81_011054 [Sarcophaga bullata]